MRARPLAATLAAAALLAGPAVSPAAAETPPNDDFGNATDIVGPLPFNTTADLSAATTETLEPACDGSAVHTVWYRFKATDDVTLTARASTAEGIASLGIYTGPHRLLLDEERCVVNSTGLSQNTMFEATSGTTYFLQLGLRAPGTATVEFGPPGALRGTVTNVAGDPLQGVCVELGHPLDTDEFGVWGGPWTLTGPDGTYRFDDLRPGPHHVWFLDCNTGVGYDDQYYDGVDSPLEASIVWVPTGGEIAGIDAVLEEPGPLGVRDLAVTAFDVSTDHWSWGAGPVAISISTANLGEETQKGTVWVEACPLRRSPALRVGSCQKIGALGFSQFAPGDTATYEFSWRPEGNVGDMRITGSVYAFEGDNAFGNNVRQHDVRVIAGGAGIGAGYGDEFIDAAEEAEKATP